MKQVYYINAFPETVSNPFNLYSLFNVFNPNFAHVT